MNNQEIHEKVQEVLKNGNWMIRRSDNGKSHNNFQWNSIGEWTEAPDWNPKAECGGGLHGNGVNTTDSYWSYGEDIDFCEIDVASGIVYIDGFNGKIKCRRARVLLRNELPEGLKHINGDLDLSETPITKLPDSLISISGTLNLSKTKINELPNGLTRIGGSLFLSKTPIKRSFRRG